MTLDSDQLRDFAQRYTGAWCSQDPTKVAGHYAPEGSLTINGGAPAVGRAAIAESARSFMTAVPDMQVLMNEIVVGAERYRLSLDAHRHQHRAGRHRQERPHPRIRGMDDRRGRVDRRVTGPLRPGRIRPPDRAWRGNPIGRRRLYTFRAPRLGVGRTPSHQPPTTAGSPRASTGEDPRARASWPRRVLIRLRFRQMRSDRP